MDLALLGDLVGEKGLAAAAVGAVFLAGLRHGFDIDHVAVISDIASSQRETRRSLLLSTAYAVGHMVVLFVLGVAAVLAGDRIPSSVDSFAARAIGFTLVAYGLYVVYSLVRFRRAFRMASRWMLVVAGARRALEWMRPRHRVVIEHAHPHSPDSHHGHEHDGASIGTAPAPSEEWTPLATKTKTHAHVHTHVVEDTPDPFTEYGVKTSFVVGMVHGVGAETPSQLLLFTAAAGVAGTLGSVALVGAFVVGLLLGNSILALVTTAGFTAGRGMPLLYMGLAGTTAFVSIYVGGAYLFERADMLPSFLGGGAWI